MGGFDFTQRCKDHVEIHQVNALAYHHLLPQVTVE